MAIVGRSGISLYLLTSHRNSGTLLITTHRRPDERRQLLHRIWAFFGATDLDRDFGQELEAHLDLLAEDYRRRGLPPDEALRAARAHFGGVTQLREAHRETRGLPLLDSFLQDIRYAL